MRIDMTTREWHDLIKPVLPHVSADPETPQLAVVRIERGSRAVYAVATDRYSLAAERHPLDLDDESPPVHVRAAEAKASLALFPYNKDWDPPLKITIDKVPFPVTVAGYQKSIDRLAITIQADDGTRLVLHDHRSPAHDPLAGWRKRIGKLLIRDHSHAGPALCLNSAFFARWSAAARKGERLNVFTGREGDAPVLVTVEEHFAGGWQPIAYLTTPAEALADSPWHEELRTWELGFDETTGERVPDLATASGVFTGMAEALADQARADGLEVTGEPGASVIRLPPERDPLAGSKFDLSTVPSSMPDNDDDDE